MSKRNLSCVSMLLLVAALLGLSVQAQAQSRVALVIGNSAYQKVVNLANPAHDAQDVSEALKRLGFTVNTVVDADFDGFRRALRDFGRVATNAEIAVFYFAGHGVEIDGNNWLLPTDAQLKSDLDARTEAIGLQSAMEAVATAKTLGLVILDACRNNPFSSMGKIVATRSVQMLGLAPVEPADNVLVAYAARDGTVAADGVGRNSPYAAALLKHIETPGLEVDFLFRNIRDDVMAATNNEQQPFVYGSLSSDEIYFKPAAPAPLAAADTAPAPDSAEIAWSFLSATRDVSTLTRFVDRFPESSHVSDAKVRIASLTTAPAPTASDVPPPPLVTAASFTDSEFAQAEKAVALRFVRDTPAVEQAWDVIKETNDHTVIRHFVDRFPSGKRRVVADTRLTALGQKPITVHVTPPQLFQFDENVLAMAAADPDVMLCYQRGDQTAAECQRAFERFPDIGHFAEDIRFTLGFCQAMGNPGGCVPTVKTTWNFPTTKPGGTPGGGAAPTPTATPAAIPSPPNSPPPPPAPPPIKLRRMPHQQAATTHSGNGNNGSGKGVKYSLKYSHHASGPKHGAVSNVALQAKGGAVNTSTTSIKTATSLKVTGIKTPTVTTPGVRTPSVRVNVVPNIRLPTIR